MEIKKQIIALTKIEQNTGQIPDLPVNPRNWQDDEVATLAASIAETPELLEARGLLVKKHGTKYVILGGNMRFEALKRLGWKDAPCIVFPEDTPIQKLKQLIIKDNGSFGQWDYSLLAQDWASDCDLQEWGVTSWGGKNCPQRSSQARIRSWIWMRWKRRK